MPDDERRTGFLGRLRVQIVGDTTASDTAVAVLSALGATVHRAISTDDLENVDVVVVDRITEGVDEAYAGRVTSVLGPDGAGPSAWVTVSAFGMDGPHAHYRGSEVVVAAAGCLLAAVNDAAGTVHPAPADQALQTVGQASALAALHALSLSRERGVPVHLDVSAQEAVAFATVQQELAHILYDCPGQGSTPRYSALARVVRCADGLLNVVVVDDHQFTRVADAIGHSDWLVKYPTVTDRNMHAEEINQTISEWAGQRSKLECEAILQENGVPATAFRTVAETAASEQFVARRWPYRPETTTPTTGVVPALVRREADGASPPDGHRPRESSAAPSLADLRVVELTNVLAAPLASAMMAAMGATVVKVEERQRLDTYRRVGPFADGEPGPERAAYFMAANYNKLSVADRLNSDPSLASRLMSWGDIVVENVGCKRIARLGFDGSTAHQGLGRVSSVSVSGFGRTGPHSHYRAYAWNVHSYAGLAEAVTEHAGPPFMLRAPLADYTVGIWAATFAAAWWLGGGHDVVHVDLSMAEVVASKLLPAGAGGDGTAALRPTASFDLVAPVGGGRLLAVSTHDVAAVFAALRRPVPSPVAASRDEAIRMITAAAAGGVESTVEALQRAGIAAHVVHTPATFVTDRQVGARGFFPEIQHPVLGRRRIIALPWKEAGEPRSGYRPAPLFGQHDAEIDDIISTAH